MAVQNEKPEATPDRGGDAEAGDDEMERGGWGNKWQFLLSCVGLSVGIGNVWRFPYLAYSNGGGAFLIPYLIMLALVGKPMYYMELAFGQFAGLGPVTIWRCTPLAKGIGYAMLVVTFIVAIYYNVLMSYTIFYIASSFQAVVPWSRCDLEWADKTTCFFPGENKNITFGDNVTRISSSQQYWENFVLDITDGIDDLGGIKWDLALCLLLSWIIVCLCLFKGIKTSGKVIYFAATFPYVILIILLIRGLLLPGSGQGVLYFITPDWEKLADIKVWKAAAGQMFFSLSVSMGGLIMYSSYNPFRNNVHSDAMVVSVLDTVTSLISGLVIFSILGAMAHDLDVPIDSVVKDGPGLAFVAYPEALARLPLPQLWSVLFFFMLFILGLDSEFAMIETISTCISDEYPKLRRHKSLLCVGLGCVCYLLGLPCVTRGGQYVLTLMDEYGSSTSLIFIAICECIAITWIYGISRFCDDILFMLGHRPGWYWKLTWAITSPIILTFIFVYSIVDYKPLKYGQDYSYPDWANGIGWALFLVSVVQIPFWSLVYTLKTDAPTFKEKVMVTKSPNSEWAPSDKKLIPSYQAFLVERQEHRKRASEIATTEIIGIQLTSYGQSEDDAKKRAERHTGNGVVTSVNGHHLNGGITKETNISMEKVPEASRRIHLALQSEKTSPMGLDNPAFSPSND